MADPRRKEKAAAAAAAAERVHAGMHVALGTGSTAAYAIRELARRFPGPGALETVASSPASERLAVRLGLKVRAPLEGDRYDLMIDGADEVDPALRLTKGGGGALLREKLLARHSRVVLIAVDSGKLVERLGQRSPIPIEVVPFARPALMAQFRERGWSPEPRRLPSGRPRRSVNGNEIVDLHLRAGVEDPAALDRDLHALTGVVETGLFLDLASAVYIGRPDGSVEKRSAPADDAPR